MSDYTLKRPTRAAFATGLAVFLLLLGWDIARTYPPLRSELNAFVVLPSGIPQRAEPIIATGVVEKGDFLLMAFSEAGVATFIYESWGQAFTSAPIRYEPGTRAVMQLEMPSLTHAGKSGARGMGLLRLRLNGLQLFHQDVPYHPCGWNRIFFGENPVGGPTVGTAFRGHIFTATGEKLKGRPDALFPFRSKLLWWLQTSLWHLLPLAITAAGVAWIARILFAPRAGSHSTGAGWIVGALKCHGVFLVMVGLNLVLFTWLMTGGKFRLIYPDAFGAFYDFQAQSLLQGRLDVPEGTLGSEAFVVAGKQYGYFGLTPALLRLPLIITGVGFGHLTRSFLLADYLASLVAAYMILRYITRLRGGAPQPSPWAVLVMTLAGGAGSSLLFLSSRAYVYHEAILCGVAFALWSSYLSLRYLEIPRRGWWIGALITGVLAVQARPPVGLFALSLLGCVAAFHAIANWKSAGNWRVPVAVGALAVVGFLSLQGVAYLKFGTLDGAPLRYHVQYTPQRLANIDGRNFHLSNVRHNLDAYFLWPAFQAGTRFPFLIFDLKKRDFLEAKMDLEERTVGILYAMAGLVAFAAIAAVSAMKVMNFRRPLLLVLLASIPFGVCMLTFIATSHRYTADFCPPLIIAAAFGIAYCDVQKRSHRVLLLSAGTALSLFAVALTIGLSFHFQVDLVWGVPEEVRSNFLELRARFDRWFGVT